MQRGPSATAPRHQRKTRKATNRRLSPTEAHLPAKRARRATATHPACAPPSAEQVPSPRLTTIHPPPPASSPPPARDFLHPTPTHPPPHHYFLPLRAHHSPTAPATRTISSVQTTHQRSKTSNINPPPSPSNPRTPPRSNPVQTAFKPRSNSQLPVTPRFHPIDAPLTPFSRPIDTLPAPQTP